jgi:alkylation response protein AidB-like acyl-CoA dehydrogenase
VSAFRFEPCRLPPDTETLRAEVRAFLADEIRSRTPALRARSWMGWDADFSRKVGEVGWIGMTWPKRYGGSERSALERYVVLEEMLAAGAPVAAHWIGDRQSGPLLLRYGTEAQRAAILPRIVRGEAFFCIGMSEPDSGSDLASIRTRATRADGGWRLEGSKVWTTGAERCHFMIALVRTSGDVSSRHEGLSQLVIDLSTPGIEIRPIRNLAGEEHFNEVVLTDAVVPEDALVGREGGGWAQVMAELAFERSGPERYLSSIQVLTELIRRVGTTPDARAAVTVGRLVAQLATLRQMSLSVAGMLEAGKSAATEAALVKDLGVTFEQELPGVAQALADVEPMLEGEAGAGDLEQVLGYLVQLAPSFSLRGGTREILRGIIARGLGLR